MGYDFVSYEQIGDQKRLAVLGWIKQNALPELMTPFYFAAAQEACEKDKEFVLKTMKLNPRD
jgi:hypothetical protein